MGQILRRWAPLVWLSFVGIAAWVLWDRLRGIEISDVMQQLAALPATTLLIGVACCLASYVLVGLYEGVAVRVATGKYSLMQPFRTALVANPIGHAIGVAIVSGGAVRYRFYSAAGLSTLQIGAIILLAAMPYFLGVGWLIDLSLLLSAEEAGKALRLPIPAVLTLASIGLVKDLGWLVFVALREQPVTLRKISLRLPTPAQTIVQTAFGAAEVLLIAAVLYLFMPAQLAMSFPGFVGIYLIAIVAGQISHVPAGFGVLEAALLLMLPQVPPVKLLGAVLAYRAVFEVLPLLISLLLLLIFEITHPSGFVRWRLLRRQ